MHLIDVLRALRKLIAAEHGAFADSRIRNDLPRE
jgi:hypothetical protein